MASGIPCVFRSTAVAVSHQHVESQSRDGFVFFSQEGFESQSDPFAGLPLGFSVTGLSLKKMEQLETYQNGALYLQNSASQVPALVLHPQAGDRVLDLCASPGSKTSQMAALMQNQGEIVAVEPDAIRFARLQTNMATLGAHCVTTVLRRGESFCRELSARTESHFDKILVDAPCSGDGTFYVHKVSSFKHWSVDFVKQQAKQQKKLLTRAVSVLKPGGRLVYSTCSISPEENEQVVNTLLQTHPNYQSKPPHSNCPSGKRLCRSGRVRLLQKPSIAAGVLIQGCWHRGFLWRVLRNRCRTRQYSRL